MKLIINIIVILMFLGLNNCTSNSELMNSYPNLLTFSYQGEEYKILGFFPQDLDGFNLLIRKEQNRILLKCIDRQQDGILDEVVVGNITLEEANNIYQEGILIALENGSLKEKQYDHYYLISDMGKIFELRTYVPVDGEPYNIFAVKPISDGRTYVLRDLEADGSLDYFEEGEGELELFQSYYDKVVQKGISENNIKLSNGVYYVRN